MNEKFDKTEIQKSLLESLISSPETFSICESIIKHEFFNPELAKAVKFTKEYYSKYSALPDPFQIKAETGVKINKVDVSKDTKDWTKDNIEDFCKYKAVVSAIQDSLEDISKGDYGVVADRVQTANEVSLIKDLGFDYFKSVRDRVKRMQEEPPIISTGWKNIDDALFGGIARKELILFAGGSGVGKSFTLANLGMNFLRRGMNVLFLSLELSEDRVSQRFDQMLTGINGAEWRFKTDEVIEKVESAGQELGNLDIKMLPAGTNSNEIRAYLKQFYLQNSYYPDLFILDYLDEMSTNEYVSADNIAEKDSRCTSNLRQIGVDFNMVVATASQLNREAVEAPVLNHSHIAGGMGKIRKADVAIALRMDKSQKHSGIMEFVFLKTRNSDGVYTQHHMNWDKKLVTISDPKTMQSKENDSGPLGFKRKEKKGNISIEKDKDLGHSTNQTTNDIFDTFEKSFPNL
jgi:replicative DNA helicase